MIAINKRERRKDGPVLFFLFLDFTHVYKVARGQLAIYDQICARGESAGKRGRRIFLVLIEDPPIVRDILENIILNKIVFERIALENVAVSRLIIAVSRIVFGKRLHEAARSKKDNSESTCHPSSVSLRINLSLKRYLSRTS